MGYLSISTNVDAIKHITDDHFLRASTYVHVLYMLSRVRLSVCRSVVCL